MVELFRVGIQAFPCAQDPSIPVWFISEVPDRVDRYSIFSIPTGLWLIEVHLQSLKFLFFIAEKKVFLNLRFSNYSYFYNGHN